MSATQRIYSTRPSDLRRMPYCSTTTRDYRREWRWLFFIGTATRLWRLISMTDDLWTTVSRSACLRIADSHQGDRAAAEGRNHRRQGRSHSSEEYPRHERIAIFVTKAADPAGTDESRTGKRPRPVRTFSLRWSARSSAVQIDRVLAFVL